MKEEELKEINFQWRSYYVLKEEVYEYIERNTKELKQNSDEKYRRCIRYTEDENILENISNYIKELDDEYRKIVGEKKLHLALPVIIRDVENININVLNAFKSITVSRKKKNEYLPICSVDELKRKYEGEDEFKAVFKKYQLATDGALIGIKYESLLKLANAKHIQARTKTGNQYIALIRKKGENKSTRHRYGFIVLDRAARVHLANEEAPRSHKLELTCKKFELEDLPHYKTVFYIKE